MNTGGDPGRDDYGLPPVDIEVPDDARELDRDVHAYYRELRSLRRRMLARKVYGPLTKDGMVLPLLAGCLALTLLAATLLTVFTVGQGTVGGPFAHSSAARSGAAGTGTALPVIAAPSSPAAGLMHQPLPDAVVVAAGVPERLRGLIGPVLVLALIPQSCRCFNDLRQLSYQASRGGAEIYLVGIGGANVDSLPGRLALGAAHALDDSENSLPPTYHPPRLTAVLVGRDGSVARFVPDHGHGFQIENAVRSLVSAHAAASPSPGGKVATPPS